MLVANELVKLVEFLGTIYLIGNFINIKKIANKFFHSIQFKIQNI